MPLQPVYHCGVGQVLADLKAVSDQMFADAGFVVADKSVNVYIHGIISDLTVGATPLFGYPQFLPGGAFSLTVQGFTGKTTDGLICTNAGTTISASNFTFKNMKFIASNVRAPWLIGGDNKGHDNCIFDNCYQAHYSTTNGFIRNCLFYNVAYSAIGGDSIDPTKPLIIENNIIYGVAGGYPAFLRDNMIFRSNLIVGGAYGLTGQSPTALNNAKAYNNVILNCTVDGFHLFASGQVNQGYRFYNNTLYGNNNAIEANFTPNENNYIYNNLIFVKSGQYGVVFDNNNIIQFLDYNFYDVAASGICARIHNGTIWQNFATLALFKAAYPQFEANGVQGSAELVNPDGTGAQDYKLKANSGAIDKGSDLSATFAVDFNGKSRPKKAGFDCGAFEAPYITLAGSLTDYSIEQKDYITASAVITGTASAVFVSINGKIFALTATGGGNYQAVIRGYQIGVCANAAVFFFAFNDDYDIQVNAPTITVAATNGYDIDAIATSIQAILNTITDFKSVLLYEPKQIPALPAATLFYDGFDQAQTEAVSFTITHRFICRIYVKLHDAEDAQASVRDLMSKVLAALKLDLDFGNTVLFGFTPNASVGVLMDRDNPVIIGELTITAMLEVD